MRYLRIYKQELDNIEQLAHAYGNPTDAPAFSCNKERKVWPAWRNGYHWEWDRSYATGVRLLERITDVYLGIRPSGGRFKLLGTDIY